MLDEDNEINRMLASDLLKALAGMQLAGDGAQALALLVREPVDIVPVDVQMPVMDGLQATRLLRQPPAPAALPEIAMTAQALEEDRAQRLAAQPG